MTPWGRATLALRLLTLDPNGLGGIALHARSGPVRDAFQALLPADQSRLHPGMSPDTLLGGIDVSASLAEGTLVRQRGLLEATKSCFVLTMAERCPPLTASALTAMLDARKDNSLILLDEHTEDEQPPPAGLMDRLAFHISLEGVGQHDLVTEILPKNAAALGFVSVSETILQDIVALAVSLGITSLRAPTLAVAAARAHAALFRRKSVSEEDVIVAAELVLAPRATRLPQEEQPPPPKPPDAAPDETPQIPEGLVLPDELVLEAIQTALPPELLSKTGSNKANAGTGSGAGHKRIGNRRGRPLPARDTGTKSNAARVDLIATLRAAVPWQKLRRAAGPDRIGPIIHPRDLRYRRYEDLSDRLLVFAVDASGSAALARLAEAKGAVEILLAEAYARRDHVALISFRGDAAEVLLPPTRSLVQTKRRLAELPGGGGTPLASGLQVALETALTAGRRGLNPVIVLLTDGRSNVALDGTPNRAQAATDATQIAGQIAQAGIDAIVIDTGRRPERALTALAASLRGHYASLPRADARAVSDTVNDALSV